jgi:drug/metabolite transporter (DMT)-like permease
LEDVRETGQPVVDETVAPVSVRRPAGSGATLPYLVLAFSVLATGMSGILVKWANAPGTVNGFYRMAIAIVVLALPISMQAKRQAPFSAKHLWLAALGGLFFAIDLALWNNAVLVTSAGNATLFGNTSVIWVMLGAMLLFKERLRPAFWSGLLLALLGILIILGQDFVTHPQLGIGDLMSIVAGFFYGMFFLAAERARDRLNAFVAWWVSSLSSAIALLVLSLYLRLDFFGYPWQTYACIIALALVTQVGGYLSVNYALGHLPSSVVSPTLLGQPVVTAILAVPLLGQPITPIQALGGLMVLGGILVIHRNKQANH